MYKDYDFHNPTVKAEYDEKRNYWYLLRGPETFYDENNKLKTWSTKEESLKWVQTNHPEYRIIE
jgi:hypothetical protein